jgi:hypothetical protein
MGAIAPPGRDAAAGNKPTSHITSKKSLQKTAITGSTPSPSYPLPWLPRGHKSSAGTTGKEQKLQLAFIGYVLSKLQKEKPAYGTIVGGGNKSQIIALETPYKDIVRSSAKVTL